MNNKLEIARQVASDAVQFIYSTSQEEINLLKAKISEIEEKVSVRMLNSIKALCSDSETFSRIEKKFKESISIDAFEIERDKASREKERADDFSNIYNAAKSMKQSYSYIVNLDYEGTGPGEVVKMQEDFIMKREKLFSLIQEYDMKQAVYKS